jgi:hypothetical protein
VVPLCPGDKVKTYRSCQGRRSPSLSSGGTCLRFGSVDNKPIVYRSEQLNATENCIHAEWNKLVSTRHNCTSAQFISTWNTSVTGNKYLKGPIHSLLN